MGVETIEVRGADRDDEILKKVTLLDTKINDLDNALNIKIDGIQIDVTQIKDDVAKP